MGCVYRRGKIYWIKYYRGGRGIYLSSGSTSKMDAERLLKLKEGEAVRGLPILPRADRVQFEQAAEGVVRDYRINGKRSIQHVARRLRKHLLPFFGGMRMVAIGPADVARFIDHRQSQRASNAEINRELAILNRAFGLAIKQGLLFSKPHVSRLRENPPRRGFVEGRQLAALCAHLPENVRAVVRFAAITGWRKGEVLSLRWRQVDFSARQVVLDAGYTKNGEGRVFNFTDALEELLTRQKAVTRQEELKSGRSIESVFHRGGNPIRDFRDAWANACQKSGCTGLIFHDLRRSAVRHFILAGIPDRVCMILTGHKTRSVFERYNIVNATDLRNAATRLDHFAKERRGAE